MQGPVDTPAATPPKTLWQRIADSDVFFSWTRSPITIVASVVALEFGESELGSLKLSALLGLGFILFCISFVVLAASRFLLRQRLKG